MFNKTYSRIIRRLSSDPLCYVMKEAFGDLQVKLGVLFSKPPWDALTMRVHSAYHIRQRNIEYGVQA